MYVGWMDASWPMGWVFSHVLLGVTYYLVITPIGLILRLLGKDPMRRRFDREAKTYWIPTKKWPAGTSASSSSHEANEQSIRSSNPAPTTSNARR